VWLRGGPSGGGDAGAPLTPYVAVISWINMG
jgi:hypothetical protein